MTSPEPPVLVTGTCHLCARQTDRAVRVAEQSPSGPGWPHLVHADLAECLPPYRPAWSRGGQ